MRRPTLSVPLIVPRLVLLCLSILGWAMTLTAGLILLERSVAPGDPIAAMGGDSYAYWAAGARLVEGAPLYRNDAIGGLGAYFYPPLFAQAWALFTDLPLVADWAWRILGVLCIRYMAGSWLVAGLWMLVPATFSELTAGNVTFQLAALTVAGLRGRAEGIIPAAVVRYSSLAVVPFVWIRRPAARRGLLIGGVIAAVAVAASAVLGPELWRDYVAALGSQAGQPLEHPWIVRLLPSASADFLLRLAIAAIIVVASVRFDSPHLAYIAAFLATPVLWQPRFAVLLALPTLEGGRWLKPYLWPWRESRGPAGERTSLDHPARPEAGTVVTP